MAVARSTPELTSRWLARRWFIAFAVIYGAWVWLPWVAPLLMQAGLTVPGRLIYLAYSVFCHQLPERSFFLFGQQLMYPLVDIQAAWRDSLNPMILRQFIGNDVMGWKLAWSDRMVSFYTTIWLLALAWWPLRRRVKPLSWWGFILLLLPLMADGLTHALSDLSGIGLGFRDTNAWLAALTNDRLPLAYAGDALGSVNSWARLITGALAGIGIVWFAFPLLETSFAPD